MLIRYENGWFYPIEVGIYEGSVPVLSWSGDERYLAIWSFGYGIFGILDLYTGEWIDKWVYPGWHPKGNSYIELIRDSQTKIVFANVHEFGKNPISVGPSRNAIWSSDGIWLILGNGYIGENYINRILNLNTWQIHPLDIPEDSVIENWLDLETEIDGD